MSSPNDNNGNTMHKTNDRGNTSRLSLALLDLPLTPFGMKSPSSSSRNKIIHGNCDIHSKPSLLQLKSLKKRQPLPPLEEKENEHFPVNLQNVNTRRRERFKKWEETPIPVNGSVFQHEELDTMTITQTRSNIRREKRESLFTDIDDGSFVEFTGKPPSEKGLPQFYYTCTDENETRYSTSSKMPLSPVGFRQFIDTVKNRYGLNNIVKETSQQREQTRIPFDLDESVIAGSGDINFKRRQENLHNILNSTEYIQNTKIVHELPDISSLTLDNLSPRKISNRQTNSKTKPIECIIISESEDETEYETKTDQSCAKGSKMVKANDLYTKKTCIPNNPDLESSLISEDISLSPSVPNRRTHIRSPSKNVLTTPVTPQHPKQIVKKISNIKENNFELDCRPEVNDRVIGWVLNSPFKDSSFGTSFEVNEDIPLNGIRRNTDDDAVSSQSLDLRLSEDISSGKASGKTVFTLGRVAESPDIEDIAPVNRELFLLSESDSSTYEQSPLIDKKLRKSKETFQNNKEIESLNNLNPTKLNNDLFSSPYLSLGNSANTRFKDLSSQKQLKDDDGRNSLNKFTKPKSPCLLKEPARLKVSSHYNRGLLTEESDHSEDSSHQNDKANNNERHLKITRLKLLSDDEYPSGGEMIDISPCMEKTAIGLNLSRSRSESELNLTNKSLDRIKLLDYKGSIGKDSTLPINNVNGKKFLEDKSINKVNEKKFLEDKSTKVRNIKPFIFIDNSDASDESLPDIDFNHEKDTHKFLKQLGLSQKFIISDSESDRESPVNRVCQTPENKLIQVASRSPDIKQNVEKNQKVKSHTKIKAPITVYESNSDSSNDNFETYINSLKKTRKNNKKVFENHYDDDFLVSDNDDIEYLSDSSLPDRNLGKKIIQDKKKTKKIQRIIISSSSDSEEEEILQKTVKPKTTKPKSVAKKQIPLDNNFKGCKQLSFLSSLTIDTPLSEAHIDAVQFLRNFKKMREALATKLYNLFNEEVFENKLPTSMNIKWNPRLTKTAGFCYQQMDKSKPSGRGARIELSGKVIDCAERLRDTLIHEMCHAATWVICGSKDNHGPIWRSWASKAMTIFSELPPIRRCHSYKINCKYTYKCINCGYSIGRHSKSLDTEKKVCGFCYGKFELIVNYAKKGKDSQNKLSNPLLRGVQSTPRTPSRFAMYVKDNYGSIKKSQTGMKHKDVMKLLSEQFAKMKTIT